MRRLCQLILGVDILHRVHGKRMCFIPATALRHLGYPYVRPFFLLFGLRRQLEKGSRRSLHKNHVSPPTEIDKESSALATWTKCSRCTENNKKQFSFHSQNGKKFSAHPRKWTKLEILGTAENSSTNSQQEFLARILGTQQNEKIFSAHSQNGYKNLGARK